MRVLLFIFSQLIIAGVHLQGQTYSSKTVQLLMGTRFEITAVATTQSVAEQAVNKGIEEIIRIEELISSWKNSSQTSAVNRSAGIKPVVVDKELYDLIYRSKKISELTNGAFDISAASVLRLYTFDGEEHALPTMEQRLASIEKINWNDVILEKENLSVFLKKEGMKIGFGAIGKGMAANAAKALMQDIVGVIGGVVNASGDLAVWGESPDDDGWQVQITDPKDGQSVLGWLSLNETSVVTSGNYEKYFTHQQKRYAHIIDPTTGLPTTGIKSVTIVCPDTELADALATSVFVMGAEEGMALIDLLNGVEGLIITDDNKIMNSKNLTLNEY